MDKKEILQEQKLIGFRTTKENIIKIDVVCSCKEIDKQLLMNDMIDTFFAKNPLTVLELKVLKQRIKLQRRK